MRGMRVVLCLLVCATARWLLATALLAAENSNVALDATLDAKVDAILAEIAERQQAVGYAAGVVRQGRVVSLRGLGLADREQNVPVDRRTMFRWASISKTLTAVAALQLAERQELDLDADVRTYVPEFPEKKQVFTTRQLLCHQAGIRHYANGKIIPNERTYSEEHPFEKVILALDEFKDSPLVAPPGERFSYSTHGYILLSAVVERAGKQPFVAQVYDRIVRPLQLDSLQPDYQWIDIPHRAVGYTKREKQIEPSTNTDVSWKLGGGGYISTIDDLALWCAAITRGELLQPATWKEASTRQTTREGRPTEYGLGFRVEGKGNRLSVGHSGAQEKTRTFLVAYPHLGIGAVAMTNSEYGEPAAVVRRIVKELLREAGDDEAQAE